MLHVPFSTLRCYYVYLSLPNHPAFEWNMFINVYIVGMNRLSHITIQRLSLILEFKQDLELNWKVIEVRKLKQSKTWIVLNYTFLFHVDDDGHTRSFQILSTSSWSFSLSSYFRCTVLSVSILLQLWEIFILILSVFRKLIIYLFNVGSLTTCYSNFLYYLIVCKLENVLTISFCWQILI